MPKVLLFDGIVYVNGEKPLSISDKPIEGNFEARASVDAIGRNLDSPRNMRPLGH
jgi:hypothetical protein